MNGPTDSFKFSHQSVLYRELFNSMTIDQDDIVIDCTFGGGGHAKIALNKLKGKGYILGLDQDLVAIENGQKKFEDSIQNKKLILKKSRFSQITSICKELDIYGNVAAIYADIGVSSPQIDCPERGFSFMLDGPLDMRMDQNSGSTLTAKEIILNFSVEELSQILRDFGEEPKAFHYAKTIDKERKSREINTTLDLASIIENASPYKTKSKKHPATKVFQALRVAVNSELHELEQLLDQSLDILKVGGYLAIISFHSLEDRLVKRKMKSWIRQGYSSEHAHLPFTESELNAKFPSFVEIVKPFPIRASNEEIKANKRARSASLRIIRKLPQ